MNKLSQQCDGGADRFFESVAPVAGDAARPGRKRERVVSGIESIVFREPSFVSLPGKKFRPGARRERVRTSLFSTSVRHLESKNDQRVVIT